MNVAELRRVFEVAEEGNPRWNFYLVPEEVARVQWVSTFEDGNFVPHRSFQRTLLEIVQKVKQRKITLFSVKLCSDDIHFAVPTFKYLLSYLLTNRVTSFGSETQMMVARQLGIHMQIEMEAARRELGVPLHEADILALRHVQKTCCEPGTTTLKPEVRRQVMGVFQPAASVEVLLKELEYLLDNLPA